MSLLYRVRETYRPFDHISLVPGLLILYRVLYRLVSDSAAQELYKNHDILNRAGLTGLTSCPFCALCAANCASGFSQTLPLGSPSRGRNSQYWSSSNQCSVLPIAPDLRLRTIYPSAAQGWPCHANDCHTVLMCAPACAQLFLCLSTPDGRHELRRALHLPPSSTL